jgi:phosphoribosylformylglycinamidine synthase subunit PurQ / glutaminase
VVVRYVDDPNGAQDRAAAVANAAGNVVGIMPHPERAIEDVLGSSDGIVLLDGFVASMAKRVAHV